MKLTLTILGCGASGGVPAIGNNWGKCDPAEPRNKRLRASLAVQSEEGGCIVIDTGPDFRYQVNRAGIEKIDAIIYTHAHGDHINGLDEMQSLRRRDKKCMPIYGRVETIDEMAARFDYLFTSKGPLYPPAVEPFRFRDEELGQPHTVAGIDFIPFLQDHGTCQTLGFKFGSIGYSTDMRRLSTEAMDILKGVDTWIVDGAGYHYTENPVHASVPQVLEMNKFIGAKTVYITHLSLQMDYQTLLQELPEGVYPCYDGLKLETQNFKTP
jgi:phosphoribosyl 1,2-cyclic phosphate phosphodiesterase